VTGATIEAFVLRSLHFNPGVAMQDLRSRMRGRRPFAVQLLWSAAFAASMLAGLVGVLRDGASWADPLPATMAWGAPCFTYLICAQSAALLLLLPLQAAASISREREMRRFDELRASLLYPGDIVTGKLLPLMAQALLMTLVALPMAAWCLVLGGLDIRALVWSETVVLATVFWAVTLALVFSSYRSRPVEAMAWAFCVEALLLCLAAPFLDVLAEPGPVDIRVAGVEPQMVLFWMAACVLAVGASWLWHGLCSVLQGEGWRRQKARAAAGAVTVALSVGVFVAAAAFVTWCRHLGCEWMALCSPWTVVHAAVMDDEVVRMTGLTLGAGPDPRWAMWGASTGVLLLGGLMNWALASRLLSRYWERAV